MIDIRIGHAVAQTRVLNDAFVSQLTEFIEEDLMFYLVHGRIQRRETHHMIGELRSALKYVPIIYDAQMPSNTVLAFPGSPSELGFAV